MSSATSTAPSTPHWTTWPHAAKLRLLARASQELWRLQARPEQLEPPGDWRTWYLRGGRGAGKTRTGSETFAGWISDNPPDEENGNEWAIVAPTFGDGKSVCVEGKTSGLIRALGGIGAGVTNWNRSEGVIYCANGSIVYVDGADDGAYRIQGKNLRGLWADEVGLWRDWDTAWNQSIRFAVRKSPGRIIATGTPKMAHPLIAHLLSSPNVTTSVMKTTDNAANLDALALADLLEEYGGTTLGRQELDGEFIEALEGAILKRSDWLWYPPEQYDLLQRFDQIVHSWDTALKDKTNSDFVAGQVWGVRGPDRYLLALYHGHASLNGTVLEMQKLRSWAGELWPRVPQHVLIENTANGPDAIATMRTEVDGVHAIRVKGDKVQRALAASPALETHHCWLPGRADPDPNGKGYAATGTPADVQAFVEECAMFRGDLKHLHDDQVDAWSQMVNWTRGRTQRRSSVKRPSGMLPPPGSMVPDATGYAGR